MQHSMDDRPQHTAGGQCDQKQSGDMGSADAQRDKTG